MILPLILLCAILAACNVQAKAVFAHFMVGNTESFGVSDWATNIRLAQAAHIDAFALNIAHGWGHNDDQIKNAFDAAASTGFKLFFSFDYAGGKTGWPLDDVRSLIRKYGKHAAHYQYNGVPLVSTFEGPKQADDWHTINSGDTSCFFIPDWSSLGAGPAIAAGNGVANGLFNWAAWPTGQLNTTTYVDASYRLALNGKPYMMPVSPWFFTNMPGFDKNWLWNSGDLWYQRWQQIISLDFEPEFLQIISWNDYGESHYIGPLDDSQYEAFGPYRGKTLYNYAKGLPHDGWREHLPYLIDMYKTGTASFTKESLVVWFRTSLAGACADGETTGNTASQLQYEYSPLSLMDDRLYFSVLLASYAELSVSYGGKTYQIKDWDSTPDGGVGIYHTSIPISTTSGAGWTARVVRNGATVIDYSVPQGVSGSCPSGVTNWNPWIGSKQAPDSVNASPPRKISEQECTEGWAPDNFLKICQFTCSYGYCPSGACVCRNKGKPRTKPTWAGVTVFPANGDPDYGGLCSFACNLGFCPSYACSTTEKPLYIPETSPFNPTTCTAGQGSGSGSTSRLCVWACRYGFCPRHSCTCTSTGPLRLPPPEIDVGNVTSNFGNDNGLCSFACKRGYCPSPECRADGAAGTNGTVGTVVAYFKASRMLSRSCDKRAASFVPTDSVTHINVASAWIDPVSFAVYPGVGFSTAQIQELVNLKRQAPGLRVWISVGGWDFSNGQGASSGTQGVFASILATHDNRLKFIANLAIFMRQNALDGVDVDWEWPGAADTANYALLLQEMRLYFDANQPAGLGWGISFTAPVDTAVLSRYDLATMAASANWVNLVAYNLQGGDTSATHPSSDQRLFDAALDVFTKARVATGKINLGLGFFGRSYTLASTSCNSLGCPASGVGVVGSCSGTPSFMSYREIDSLMSSSGLQHAQHDDNAGTNYFAYGDKQWISFDDPDSITAKVKYIKSKGLLGVSIWSVELDNDSHDLLNAALYPVGLGGLADHTGAGSGGSSGYNDINFSSCTWSACSTVERPGCGAGRQILTVDRCDAQPGTGTKRYKSLCCPLDKTPDPDFCEWQGFLAVGFCSSGCSAGYVGMADDKWVVNSGGEGKCFFGQATYCCKVEQTGPALCQWEKRCVSLGADERPPDERVACSSGSKFVTYAKSVPGGAACSGDEKVNSWVPFCCDTQVDTSSFEWNGAKGQDNDCPTGCPAGKTMMSTAYLGGGADCYYEWVGLDWTDPITTFTVQRPLCVDPNALRLTVNTLPVPLKNLFPAPGPDSDKQKWHVELDPSMGGADPTPETSTNPNDGSFGWYIMSGPLSELVSFSKRDGSHWELFDCHDVADVGRRHTVRAICTTEGSAASNCNDIHLGDGVAETVVEMPPSCGPGKYAMAVSLTPSTNRTLPPYLQKRYTDLGVAPVQVYDFTFDFDFTPLQRRGKSNVLLRIDYSDDPHYWDTIVAAAPSKRKRSTDDLRRDVERDHGGSYKRYIDHLWQEDKRSTAPHELHELHARWFSGSVADWISKMRGIDVSYDLVRHRVDETVRWNLVDQSVQCDFDNGVTATARLRAWADLVVNIETAAMLTLIGNLGDLSSFDESHVLFRNKGSVKASLNLDAIATASFMTGPVELFGLQNFGATFSVPGIVTIGPNFRVLGSIDGTATLHGRARVDMNMAQWDYTQQYPDKNGRGDDAITGKTDPNLPSAAGTDPEDTIGVPKFYYDVDARGQLTVTVTPQITLGIVFASSQVPDASVDLGVNGRVVLYGSAGSNSTAAWRYCYGVNGNMDVFARINAPKLFDIDISNYYTLWQTGTFPIVAEVCAAAGSKRSDADLLELANSGSDRPHAGALISKGDGFLGSLLCPKTPADLAEVPRCPLCSGDFDSRKRTRFASMMEPREDSCILVPSNGEEVCTYLDGSAARRDLMGDRVPVPSHNPHAGKLEVRTLTKKTNYAKVGTETFPLDYGRYAPCSDAQKSGNIMKNLAFSNRAGACTADMELLTNSQIKTRNQGTGADDVISVQTDHVFESQTVTSFVEFLAGTNKNPGAPAGYIMPSAEWVKNVILGIDTGRATFDFDTTVLNFPGNMGEQPLFWVRAYGFGRSDGNLPTGGPDQGAVPKARGESHLVLADGKMNLMKGQWFRGANPSTGDESGKLGKDRFHIRNTAGVFPYLRWSPSAPSSGDRFATVQPVWHKWMRVSNWVDLVCHHADQQIPWQDWTDGPKPPGGGTPSLRALWAYFVEKHLEDIEDRAATWSALAAADYKTRHGTQRGEPAWSNSAFGPGGFAAPANLKLPRVPATGGGWSQFGAFANVDMTLDGRGSPVILPAPAKLL